MNNWFFSHFLIFLEFSSIVHGHQLYFFSSTKGKSPPTFILLKPLFPFYPLSSSVDIQLIKNWWAVVDDYIDVLLHDLSLESGYTISF